MMMKPMMIQMMMNTDMNAMCMGYWANVLPVLKNSDSFTITRYQEPDSFTTF